MPKTRPSRDDIEKVIQLILYVDGPDRHVDGADVIADYIEAALLNVDGTWVRDYLRSDRVKRRGGVFALDPDEYRAKGHRAQ